MSSYQATLQTLHQQLSSTLTRLVTKAETNGNVVQLNDASFANGTYIISSPGVYRLTESVVFNPNSLAAVQLETPSATSWDSGGVLPTQLVSNGGSYDDRAYALGFFAAIAVTCADVVIDLNGFSMTQSAEHALQQRFYAHIELADQPFISRQGPNDFGPKVDKASNCFIINGHLGLTSHHGIHGNGNTKIYMRDLTFSDFEVAAIALNGARDVSITNCTISNSRTDLPVLGTFSSARFLRPYLDKLVANGYSGLLNVAGVNKSVTTIRDELKVALNNVFADLITNSGATINKTTHLPEWKVFHNDFGVIDGNSYGIITNSLGVAVNGFPNQYTVNKSQYIYLDNVTISNLKAHINEVPAIPSTTTPTNTSYGRGSVQIDPIGAVFQTQNKDADGNWVTTSDGVTYTGNVVANAQAMVARAIHDGASFAPLSVTRNSITSATLDWIAGSTSMTTIVPNMEFVCNGDTMFHVNKGVIGFKMDATDYLFMNNCRCVGITNTGNVGSDMCAIDYKNKVGKSSSLATYYGYGGANTRGWSLATSNYVTLESCSAINIVSNYGNAYGFDVHLYCNNVELSNCEADEIKAGNADGLDISIYNNNPTPFPIAYGFHVQKEVERFTYHNLRSDNLSSIFETISCSLNMRHL